MRRRSWLLAAVTAAAGACTTTHASRSPRPAASAAAPPEAYYEVPGPIREPTEDVVEERHATYEVRRWKVPPRVPPDLADVPRAEDPIDVLYFRPVGEPGRRPLVLVSPILGNKRLVVAAFAARIAQCGFHAALVFRKDLDFDPEATLDRAEDELRLIVQRSRQVLDLLVRRPDVDPTRLGTFGVSAGAVVSAILAGTDARLTTNVLVLGGGPFADVVVDTDEDQFKEYGEAVQRALGVGKEEVRERLRRTVRTDPVLVAPRVNREGTLLLLARFDESVPFEHGVALWEAMGRPARIDVPFGHYTTFVLWPWLEGLTTGWFQSHFGDPIRPPETTTGGGSPPPPVR